MPEQFMLFLHDAEFCLFGVRDLRKSCRFCAAEVADPRENESDSWRYIFWTRRNLQLAVQMVAQLTIKLAVELCTARG